MVSSVYPAYGGPLYTLAPPLPVPESQGRATGAEGAWPVGPEGAGGLEVPSWPAPGESGLHQKGERAPKSARAARRALVVLAYASCREPRAAGRQRAP